MKKAFSILTFFAMHFIGLSQESNFSVYNDQIAQVKENVKYFEIEKINEQFYMLV